LSFINAASGDWMLRNGKMKDVKESGYDWKVQSHYWR